MKSEVWSILEGVNSNTEIVHFMTFQEIYRDRILNECIGELNEGNRIINNHGTT